MIQPHKINQFRKLLKGDEPESLEQAMDKLIDIIREQDKRIDGLEGQISHLTNQMRRRR